MATRRIPLGDVPNAANSPFRAVAAAASKRSRDQLEAQEDFSYDLQPRTKRQALQVDRSNVRTSPKKVVAQFTEGRVFTKRSTDAQPTIFERKLLAAKDGRVQQNLERQDKTSQETLDGIRQWQKHYKREFPSFVFYFEGIPEDVRVKCSKCVRNLGAREEKFFSKEVTHVITTRTIPEDSDIKDAALDMVTSPPTSMNPHTSTQPRTINPSLLDRPTNSQGQTSHLRNKFTVEASTGKRAPASAVRDVEPRKGNAGNADILWKAKEMKMKVWQLEKLQRIMNTMFDVPKESQAQSGQPVRVRAAHAPAKGDREADLSRMLRNERLNGPSDRDSTVALTELVPFKGPYIYIRDMDERTKPVLVRDYPRPPKKELGEWPQFRCVSQGRCPFVEEVVQPSKAGLERAKIREEEVQVQKQNESRPAPRTRATTVREDAEAEAKASIAVSLHRPLQESMSRANSAAPPPGQMPAPAFCPPPPVAASTAKSPAKEQRFTQAHAGTRLFGGEPAASGLQPSNITSAIRSQMISSTAAAPGAKAGTSKEVHGLKRKVLEKNAGPAINSVQTRQRALDPVSIARAERCIQAPRQTRRQALEIAIHQDEDLTQSEEDEDVWLAEDVRRHKRGLKKALEKKDLKPGYCENCREKYDDFDDHIVGRKHRKFALTQENWKDLDRLLAHLGRRLKEPDSESF